jgi:membrane glycosyltransferase
MITARSDAWGGGRLTRSQEQSMGWADIATNSDLQMLRGEIHTAIAELKSALLMWMVPTMLASVALGVTLARIT